MAETDAPPERNIAGSYRSPVDEATERLRHGGRRLRGRLDRSRRVVLRDFLIYEIKLFLDGLKGAAMGLLTIPALVLDLVHPGERPGHRFYRVMRIGERLDNWLSLYGVAEAAEQDPDGMFGVSRAGSPTLLGRLEAVVDSAVVGHDADHLGGTRQRPPDRTPTTRGPIPTTRGPSPTTRGPSPTTPTRRTPPVPATPRHPGHPGPPGSQATSSTTASRSSIAPSTSSTSPAPRRRGWGWPGRSRRRGRPKTRRISRCRPRPARIRESTQSNFPVVTVAPQYSHSPAMVILSKGAPQLGHTGSLIACLPAVPVPRIRVQYSE